MRAASTHRLWGDFFPVSIVLGRVRRIADRKEISETLSMPPLIITFILSGGTPVMRYTASLNAAGGRSGSSWTSYVFPACLMCTCNGAMAAVKKP